MHDAVSWLMIMNSVLFSAAFFSVFGCLMYFLSNRNAGHRTLIKLQATFFFLGGVRYAWAAYALYVNRQELNNVLMIVSTITCSIYAGYLVSSRKDVMSTLTVSENNNRIFKDELSDLGTLTSGLAVRAHANNQRAVTVARNYANKDKVKKIQAS